MKKPTALDKTSKWKDQPDKKVILRCLAWPPKHDWRISATESSMTLIADREKEATRMKPGERGEGDINVPNFAWTSF
jgi:hypothetical protein